MVVQIDALPTAIETRDHVVPVMKDGFTASLTVGQILDLLVGAAPGSLDTLNELAAALGDDANFAATVTAALAAKADTVQATVEVASGSTTNIGAAASWNVRVTGTSNINAFDAAPEGSLRFGRFADALTLAHNGTSLILPGGSDILVQANDCFLAKSLGSGNWIVLFFMPANGQAVSQIGAGSITTTTLATTALITGIQTNTRHIHCVFEGLQLVNNGSQILAQFGSGGALVTTGYEGSGGRIATSAAASIQPTNGAALYTNANVETVCGDLSAWLIDPAINSWRIKIEGETDGGIILRGGALVALPGACDRLAFVASSGNIVAGGKINMRQYS